MVGADCSKALIVPVLSVMLTITSGYFSAACLADEQGKQAALLFIYKNRRMSNVLSVPMYVIKV